MTMAVLERIGRALTARRPAYFASMLPGLEDAALDAFESRFGLPLPLAFRALYRWRNGSNPDEAEPLTGNLIFSPLEEVGEFKEILDGMIGHDFEEPGWWRREWIPMFHNGAGDHLCLDMGATEAGLTGQMLTFYHDEARRPVRAQSLKIWLNTVAQTLERSG